MSIHRKRTEANVERENEEMKQIYRRAVALLNSQDLSLVDWINERYHNAKAIAETKQGEERAGWLEDASYLLRAREALKQVAVAGQECQYPNIPLRMLIALRILRAWNSGTAGFNGSVVSVIHKWIDDGQIGQIGPIPWIESPSFAEWAEQNGYSKTNEGFIGITLRMEIGGRKK